MKKEIIVLLISAMCFTMAGCSKKEADVQTSSDVEITTEDGTDDEETNGEDSEGAYTVSSEDGQASIKTAVPAGYEYADYSSETQITYTSEDMNQIIAVSLSTDDISAVQERMVQEVNYQTSANANGSEVIEDVQTISSSGQEISYFHYSYAGLEGCRIWAALDDGSILIITAENMGDSAEKIDAVHVMDQILM